MEQQSRSSSSPSVEDPVGPDRADHTRATAPAPVAAPVSSGGSIEVLPPGGGVENEQADDQVSPATAEDQAAALRRERDDYLDRLLRQAAEFDNYRKRVERERKEQAETAAMSLLFDLLSIVDDFERALEADYGPGGEPYRKGIEIIYKQFLDLLRKRGVTSIESLGVQFDPRVHQAVIHEASPGHEEGEVIAELRRGYMLGDRLLRPAMVKVAKA